MLSSRTKTIVFYWLPVIIWCAFIFYLSSIPSLKSELPGVFDLLLRKVAHFTEFAVLTFLFFRAASFNMNKNEAIVHAVLFSFVFSLTDEYHQTFVFGRSGNLFDVVIDSMGIFFIFYLVKTGILNRNKIN